MKKKILCALWLACPILLSGCSGTIGNIPDNPSTDIEPSVAVSTPAPVKESAPAETGPQETTILVEPDPIVDEHTGESAEPSIENVLNKDILVFAGVYTAQLAGSSPEIMPYPYMALAILSWI